jgi:hypothetical protein
MGFNMSWMFVDGINPDALYAALDLAPTGEMADWCELGITGVPLAGATLKSGWCAVFAKYALIMDATKGTDPPRLARLPATSRAITCVVPEHAMVSYSSLRQGGRHVWQIRHHLRHGGEHLEVSGDVPAGFAGFRDMAIWKRRDQEERRKPDWGYFDAVEWVFDVPLDTAATVTGYWHTREVENDFFSNVQTLVPVNGNVLTRLSHPPKWWQTVGSIEYRSEGDERREDGQPNADGIREMIEPLKRSKVWGKP